MNPPLCGFILPVHGVVELSEVDAFQGIRVCVAILILDVGIKMIKKMKKKPLPRIILAVSCAVMLIISLSGIKISSITVMLTAGLVSLCVSQAKKKGGKA